MIVKNIFRFLVGKYSLGRISLSLLQEVLPEVLLEPSSEKKIETSDTNVKSTKLNERRLCCICGPIPFMKEANRYSIVITKISTISISFNIETNLDVLILFFLSDYLNKN